MRTSKTTTGLHKRGGKADGGGINDNFATGTGATKDGPAPAIGLNATWRVTVQRCALDAHTAATATASVVLARILAIRQDAAVHAHGSRDINVNDTTTTPATRAILVVAAPRAALHEEEITRGRVGCGVVCVAARRPEGPARRALARSPGRRCCGCAHAGQGLCNEGCVGRDGQVAVHYNLGV